MMTTKIDTHQHLLYPNDLNYPWVADVPPLQRPYPLEDYKAASEGLDVAGSVFMEVDVAPGDAIREVEWVERLASGPDSGIVGIIAKALPEADDFGEQLEALKRPLLKGIRRVLHTQPDALSCGKVFRENLRRLERFGLSFDLCVRADQLPVAIELVDACSEVNFVLDHCGVPDIAGGAFDDWSADLAELARRERVVCKISGLPAYCEGGKTGSEVLRPWVERVVKCFGWDRVLWGGDWPVCTLNGDRTSWVRALEALLAEESEDHRKALFVENARRVYRL